MKTNKEINTNLTELTLQHFNAITKPLTDEALCKYLTLNVGTKVGEAQHSADSMINKIMDFVRAYRDGLQLSDFELWLEDMDVHHHTAHPLSDKPTMVGDVPIYETTIRITFFGNFSLSTAKALILGLCHATCQEAIPMLIEAQYLTEESKHPKSAFHGAMVGQSVELANRWGAFNPQYFIK